jgi:hypothetical protein
LQHAGRKPFVQQASRANRNPARRALNSFLGRIPWTDSLGWISVATLTVATAALHFAKSIDRNIA